MNFWYSRFDVRMLMCQFLANDAKNSYRILFELPAETKIERRNSQISGLSGELHEF